MPFGVQKIVKAWNRKTFLHQGQGSFSVKSAYSLARELNRFQEEKATRECSNSKSQTCLYKGIWGVRVPSKIKHFIWRACLNTLPTREKLKQKSIVENLSCAIYVIEAETCDHFLCFCPYAKEVRHWSEVGSFQMVLGGRR